MVSVGHDPGIGVWDYASGQLVTNLTGPAEWHECVAFAPNGNFLAAGAWRDGAVRVWSARTWQELASLPGAQEAGRSALAISPDSRLFAWSSGNDAVRVVEVPTWIEVDAVTAPESKTMFLAFSPDVTDGHR